VHGWPDAIRIYWKILQAEAWVVDEANGDVISARTVGNLFLEPYPGDRPWTEIIDEVIPSS
jgi:hypothetical protein